MRHAKTSKGYYKQNSRDLMVRKRDVATNIRQPSDAVELGEDLADLPGAHLSLGIRCFQDGDTLDRAGVGSKAGVPSQSNRVASERFKGKEVERNGRLSTLTLLKSSLAGESWTTDWQALESEDRVGIVDEVVSQDRLGSGGCVVGYERAEACHEILGRSWCQALCWVVLSSPETTHPPWCSDRGGNKSCDGERAHNE